MVKKKYSYFFLIILGLVSIAIIVEVLHRPSQCDEVELSDLFACQSVYRLHNNDVSWDGTYFGLNPRLSFMADIVVNSNRNVAPFLLAAVNDVDRFAVAHVVLTYRFEGNRIGGVTAWNGLKVQLDGNGRVSYEGNDLDKLYRYWEQKLSEE